MKAPYFSVIIPSYNRAHAIKSAVESILEQSFQDFEIIIVDDASTDNTKEVVALIEDNRVHYILNPTNQERCVSRNIGISKANGEYICFLDSDDYHLPEHLEKLHAFIQFKKEKEAFYFTNAWDETAEGVRTERLCPLVSRASTNARTSASTRTLANMRTSDNNKKLTEALEVNEKKTVNFYAYFLRYTVNPQRWCVHRSIFEKVKFDPEVTICEDMDTSLRIVNAGYPVYQLNERTTVYVAAADSFTHGDAKKWEKELFYLKRIFAKKELKGKLPVIEKKRLLSMCYFHLSNRSFALGHKLLTIKLSILSFLLYPIGYNAKTNKILLVNVLYTFFSSRNE